MLLGPVESASFYEVWTLFTQAGQFHYDTYGLFKSGEYLVSSAESLEASLNVTTQGLLGSSLIGEPGNSNTTNVSRTIANH